MPADDGAAQWRGSGVALPERGPTIDVGNRNCQAERRQLHGLVKAHDAALPPIAGAVVGDDLDALERYGDVVLAVRHTGIDATPPSLVCLGVASGEDLEQDQGILGD